MKRILLALVMMVAPAAATTVSPKTVERLVQVSELVVEGRSSRTRSGISWASGIRATTSS